MLRRDDRGGRTIMTVKQLDQGARSEENGQTDTITVWQPPLSALLKNVVIPRSLLQTAQDPTTPPKASPYKDPLNYPLTAIVGLVATSLEGGKLVDLIVRECNPGFASRLGTSPEALNGSLLFRKRTKPLPLEMQQELLLAMEQNQSHWQGEFEDTKSETERWYRLEAARLGEYSPLYSLHLTDISVEVKLRKELEQSYELARTDPLTGLLNRRGLGEKLKGEINRAWRDATPVSVVQIDIDHFKSVNDKYGHDVGDKALKLVADNIGYAIRDYDAATRPGGEEFTVVLPKTDRETAAFVAERIRRFVEENTQITIGEETFSVTVSLGVAEIDFASHKEQATPEEIAEQTIKSADVALYASKTGGRNRVTVSVPLRERPRNV